MKLSLAWIFDHIDADWRSVDVDKVVAAFNKTTAEIEKQYQITVDTASLFLGKVSTIANGQITLFIPELAKEITVTARSDARIDDLFLLKKSGSGFNWAQSTDLGAGKEFILPPVYADEKEIAGAWKEENELHDWIIEVDNKSINHRPDLWCHRGIAREIAAMFNLKLRPIDAFLIDYPQQDMAIDKKGTTGEFTVCNAVGALCKRFAGVRLSVNNNKSLLWMLLKLVRIDSKPIDAIVDTTNYVMLDMSQPLHAFDAEKIGTKKIEVRFAHNKEKIKLLDDDTVELVPQDLVITDGKEPIALAGVMGGASTAVSGKTSQIFLEAAHFDPGMIRRTSIRSKKRTEASARFEKNLDPNQNITAIKRFIHIAHNNGLLNLEKEKHSIVSLGSPVVPSAISIDHQFIEQSLGVKIESDFIIKTLEKLQFPVSKKDQKYMIEVPSFRATKDIAIAQDIVEEIGRFFGYENIPAQLPTRSMAPFHTSAYNRVAHIKEIMAFGCSMNEVYNYSLYDQEFINSIGYQPTDTAQVLAPVSENWRQLVTSLVPGLLKNINDNAAIHDQLNFFEWARIWQAPKDFVHEHKRLSGIFFNKKNSVDFYEAKAQLQKIFDALRVTVSWEQVANSDVPWFAAYQTALIKHKTKVIGIAGKVKQSLLHKFTLGDAFIFELDGNFLLDYNAQQPVFKQLPKFQPVDRDISMLVPLVITVDQLLDAVRKSDVHIIDVMLIDVFEKAEWGNQRSITLKFIISDPEKILSKEETETIWEKVAYNLKSVGAQIR